MGKASSKKKIARAAKAGGGRARTTAERSIVFPVSLALVVILGTLLVVYARDNRRAEPLESPTFALSDHWHSAYGIYICDSFLPDLPEFTAPNNGGTHTHGDGLIHIHPFSEARSGDNATLENWMLDAGGDIGEDRLDVPFGELYEEGTSTCEGDDREPIVQVHYWPSTASVEAGDDAQVFTRDFDLIRFRTDGEVFVVAFAPEGVTIGAPPSLGGLAGIGADLGVDPADIPDNVGAGPDGVIGTEDDVPLVGVGDTTEGDSDTSDDDPSSDAEDPADENTPSDDEAPAGDEEADE